MMQFDRISLGKQSRELGFVRDTFEKVLRLADVLKFMEGDGLLSQTLALKGGTAINLTIFNLPRLSVDIDLDFSQNVGREEMLEKRKDITEKLSKYMKANGYHLSQKSKSYHALDSFVYEYQNTGGMKDNLKIEINYMLRCHILMPTRRKVNLTWSDAELTVLSVAPIETFASKIVALLNRTAPRDLYDVHNMLQFELFDESEQDMLRKCVVFYSCIGSDTVPQKFSFDSIKALSQNRMKTDLQPVLRNGAFFELEPAQEKIISYLSELLVPTEQELAFLKAFSEKQYTPELFFDENICENVKNHPMAIWKCSQNHE